MRVLDVTGNTEAEDENEAAARWKGDITASIAAPLEAAWQIASDFSGLHKFVPIVEVCEHLKGCNRTPGCLRFYTMSSATGLPGGTRKAWAKDRLLNIDELTHSYTYAVEGSNMHLDNCQIRFTASYEGGGGEGGRRDKKDGNTIVRWAWEMDPVKKSTKEKTLGEMSEFGCTFIKGLEAAAARRAAAAATNDSIDSDFEGAPPETLCGAYDGSDAAADGYGDGNDDGGDGTGRSDTPPPPPVLSLMKSRLETLTQSLNRISQKLEDGPIPPHLYHAELESLKTILAESRQSLLTHLNGYMSDDAKLGQKSNPSLKKPNRSEKEISLLEEMACRPIATTPPSRGCRTTASEGCRRKCLDEITRLCLSKLEKGSRTSSSSVGGQGRGTAAAAPFPPLLSKDEGLRVEMDKASRDAYEAFQDFSTQLHNDLRDDISHQLESVETRLESMSPKVRSGAHHARSKRNGAHHTRSKGDGAHQTHSKGDGAHHTRLKGDGDKCGPISGPTVGGHQNHPQTSIQDRRYPSSNGGQEAKMAPPLVRKTNNDAKDSGDCNEYNKPGQGEFDRSQSRREQKSPEGMHSVRVRSGKLFRDLLEEKMSQDSDHASANTEPQSSPRILEITNSSPELTETMGCDSCCQPEESVASNSLNTTRAAQGDQPSHPQGSESGTFWSSSQNVQGDTDCASGGFEGGDHQHVYELVIGDYEQEPQELKFSDESGEGSRPLQDSPEGWQHRGSKMRRTALNLKADLSRLQIPGNSTSQELQSPEESGEGFQPPQDGPEGWKHRGSKMRRTALNLKADLSRLQIPGNTSSQEVQSSEESGESGEGIQSVQDSPEGWQHRGSKMRRTALNLKADLSRLQISENKLQDGSPDDSRAGEFLSTTPTRRLSRLPPDIWPHFAPGESNFEGDFRKQRDGRDSSRRKLTRHDLPDSDLKGEEFLLRPASQKTQRKRAVQQHSPFSYSPSSSSSSSCSSRSSKHPKKIPKSKPLPPKILPFSEPVPQTVTGVGDDVTSPVSSLEPPLSGNPSRPQDQQSESPLSAQQLCGQGTQRVVLDFQNEIAPGVFHSRQGKQTRVIIDIPEDLEARLASRRELNSLIRKNEIYKEFALLGIQKPPSEAQLLEDFENARYNKQQPSSGKETCCMAFPPAGCLPYYAGGRVFSPDAGASPRKVQQADVSTVPPITPKPPISQNAGQKIILDAQVSKSKSTNSRSRPPKGRIVEKGPRYERQLNGTNNSQKIGAPTTSEGLRGDTTARELAPADSKRTKPPQRGGIKGEQRAHQQPVAQPCRHGLPSQKRDSASKGYGRMTNVCGSKGMANPKSGVLSLTESPQALPCACEGKSKPIPSNIPKAGNGGKATGERNRMDYRNEFIHQEIQDEIASNFSFSEANLGNLPEIRIYSQADNLLKISPPAAIAIHTRDSPSSGNDASLANILIDFPRDSRDPRQLELPRYPKPPSRQGSLDEVVNKLPSESGSSAFDPYRQGGKFGSIEGSSGSDSINNRPFSRQLHIADLHPTPTSPEEPHPSLIDSLPNPNLTPLHFDETDARSNLIDSSMYVDRYISEGQPIPNSMASSSERCHDCPFRQLKKEVDEFIQSSQPGSPRTMSREFNFRVSWDGKHPHESPSSEGTESLGPSSSQTPLPTSEGAETLGPSSSQTPLPSSEDNWAEMPRPPMENSRQNVVWNLPPPRTRPHILSDDVPTHLDAKTPKSFRDAQTQTDMVPDGEGLMPPQSTQIFTKPDGEDAMPRQSTQTATYPEGEGEGPRSPRSTLTGPKPKGEGLRSSRSTLNSSKPEGEGEGERMEPPQAAEPALKPQGEEPRGRRYTQILDQMASTAGELSDDPNARFQKVDDMVQLTGDAGLMSSWNAKKKRRADELSMGTRSTITMLNAAINVKEFDEDSRSYSFWLDGAAQQSAEGAGLPSRTPDTQTSKAVSEELELAEDPKREPRFREDSAANFLGSVAGQILHKFDESPKGDADELDPSRSREPRFREDSAANFLGTMSQKIVQEFTEQNPNPDPDQPLDLTEGTKERRFRERSAMKFLETLSEQLLPQFKNRRGSKMGEGSESGERKFREMSAINFLDALRDLVLESSRGDSTAISELPSESQSEVPRLSVRNVSTKRVLSMRPTAEDSGSVEAREEIALPNANWNSQLSESPEGQGSSGGGWNSPDSQAFSGEGSSNQPGSEGPGTPGDGLSQQIDSVTGPVGEDFNYQPGSEGPGTCGDDLSQQPELVSGSLGEGFNYQPESEGQGSPYGELSDQPGLEVQPFPDGTPSYQPELEGRASALRAPSYQPGSEGQMSSPRTSSYQRGSKDQMASSSRRGSQDQAYLPRTSTSRRGSQDQASPLRTSTSRRGSQDQASPPSASSYQRGSKDQPIPSRASSYQRGSQDQASTSRASTYHRGSKDQTSPTRASSYQRESQTQAFPDTSSIYQPETELQSSPGGGFNDQPQSEGQIFLDGGFSDHPQLDGQVSPDGGYSDQPQSEGQTSQDGGFSDEYQPEGQTSPEMESNYQPEPEGQVSAEEGGMSDQPGSKGQISLEEALSDQPESEIATFPDGGFNYEPESEGQASTDGGLGYQPDTELKGYPDGGMSDQLELEDQEEPPDEDLSDQPGPPERADESESSQADGSTTTTTDQGSQNLSGYGASRRNSQVPLGAVGPRGSRRSSQVAVLNEMLQDLHATVSRSRQNSVSNPGGL